jgi:hypothetical protein
VVGLGATAWQGSMAETEDRAESVNLGQGSPQVLHQDTKAVQLSECLPPSLVPELGRGDASRRGHE